MSRRARTRNAHPRRCALNSIEIAINGARRLSAADVDGHLLLITRAKDELSRGIDC